MSCRAQATLDLQEQSDLLALEIVATRLKSVEFLGQIARYEMGETLAAVAARWRENHGNA